MTAEPTTGASPAATAATGTPAASAPASAAASAPAPAGAPPPWREPTGTGALLVNGRGQYLLHLRDANKPIWQSGAWALPGGGREPGETPADTIRRELREEAGLDIAGLEPFAVVHNDDADGPTLVYAGAWEGDPSRLTVTEGIMLRWTDPGQIRWLTMDPGTTAVIERHRADPAPRTDPEGRPEVLRVAGADALSSVVAHLYLEREGAVLLGRRPPSSARAPGMWQAPAGRCGVNRGGDLGADRGVESPRAAVARVAAEQAGLVIAPDDLALVHTVHFADSGSDGARPRLGLFFAPARWHGRPAVLAPGRYAEWRFWPLDGLPDDLADRTRVAVQGIGAGTAYSETGWS